MPVHLKEAGLLAAIAISCCVPASAHAATAPLTMEKCEQRYVVNQDGSWDKDMQLVLRINTDKGIKDAAQQAISYNKTLDTLEVVEAYTWKADGRKLAVGSEQIREQQTQQSTEAAMFIDERVKVVIFSDVKPGDRVVLHTRQHESEGMFAGQFQAGIAVLLPTEQEEISFELPADRSLHVDARGFSAIAGETTAGHTIYNFSYDSTHFIAYDPNAVNFLDYGNRLLVSTMPDPAALGAAYEASARGKARATPAVAALAKQIVQGITERRARALALALWVRDNIRYVALYVGAGSVVPHESDEILAHRFGDCKDHATLLQAMLAAVNIDSSQALINLDNSYLLSSVGALGSLNHAINYLPEFDLYIDTTASDLPPGLLLDSELNKPVVLSKSAKVARTPAGQENRIIVQNTVTLEGNGNAHEHGMLSVNGNTADHMRDINRNIAPNSQSVWTETAGAIGTYEADYRNDSQSGLPDDTDSVVISPIMLGLATLENHIAINHAMVVSRSHVQDFPCPPQEDWEEIVQYLLPDNFAAPSLPKPFELKRAGLAYASNFALKQEKNSNKPVVELTRSLHVHFQSTVCTAQDHAVLKSEYPKLMMDVAQPFTMQRKLP